MIEVAVGVVELVSGGEIGDGGLVNGGMVAWNIAVLCSKIKWKFGVSVPLLYSLRKTFHSRDQEHTIKLNSTIKIFALYYLRNAKK